MRYRWNHLATSYLLKDVNGIDFAKDFPSVYRYAGAYSRRNVSVGSEFGYRWHNEMLARPGVKKGYDLWQSTIQ